MQSTAYHRWLNRLHHKLNSYHGYDWDQAEELLEQRDADLYSSFIAGHRPSDVAEWLTA